MILYYHIIVVFIIFVRCTISVMNVVLSEIRALFRGFPCQKYPNFNVIKIEARPHNPIISRA